MRWLRNFWRAVFDRDRLDRELDEEVRSYLDLLVEEKMDNGMSFQEARREAKIELGGTESLKERVRDVRIGAAFEGLYRDVRLALRSLFKRPAFTAVAVATLALAIGANTAIFSVVDAVLLEPLPFPEPHRLVRLWSAYPQRGSDRGSTSALDLKDWGEQSESFQSMAGFPSVSLGGFVWIGGDGPEEIETTFVTEGFFETLGADARVGRTLAHDDHIEGQDRVVVLSHRNWQARFGGRPDIVGRTLILDGNPFTVIGVMPASFEYPYVDSEMWAPLSLIPPESVPRERYVRWLNVVGRLRTGASLEAARIEISGIAARRAHEFGLRMVLGARARDVLATMLARSSALAALGIALGLAGAFWVARTMGSLLFEVESRDPCTFAIVSLIALGVALLAAAFPGLAASRVEPVIALRHE